MAYKRISPQPIVEGGTGAQTLTGVVIGHGTSALTGNTVTQHDVLVGGASNAITSVAPSSTAGVPLISAGSSSDPAFGTAVVAGGGTGDTSFTAYSVICGGTTSTGALQNVSGVGSSGQVLTSAGASALPTWQTPAGGLSYVTTNTDVTNMTSNTVYILTNVWGTTNTVNLGLPLTSNIGDIITLITTDDSGTSTSSQCGGWSISQGTGQSIKGTAEDPSYATVTSTTVGATGFCTTANSSLGGTGFTLGPCAITFICTTANLTWRILSVDSSMLFDGDTQTNIIFG